MYDMVKILGLINLLLVIFQLLSGLRVIKIPHTVHRRTGIILLICAVLHATAAFALNA